MNAKAAKTHEETISKSPEKDVTEVPKEPSPFWKATKENAKGIALLSLCGFALIFSLNAGGYAAKALFGGTKQKAETSPQENREG